MLPGIWENFKNRYPGNLLCPLCFAHQDNQQQSSITCPEILENAQFQAKLHSVGYNDIFDSQDKQVR